MTASGYGFRIVLLVFFLVLTVGALVQSWSVYAGLALTEIGLILVPTLLATRFLLRRGEALPPEPAAPWRELGWRLPSPSPLRGVVAGAGVGLLASGMAIGLTLPMLFLHLYLGARYPGLPLPLATGTDFLLALLTGVGLAAICEETLFRGLLLRSQRSMGRHAAVWITAICFGFLHMDPIRFLATTALGAVFGYLAWATGSILPSVAAHAANNLMALSLAWFSGPDPAEQPPLDWNGLTGEVSRQLEEMGAAGGAMAGRGAAAVLVATSVGFLIGGAVLALLIGLILRGLERSSIRSAVSWNEERSSVRALLRDPAAWGVTMLGLGMIVLSLIQQHGAAG